MASKILLLLALTASVCCAVPVNSSAPSTNGRQRPDFGGIGPDEVSGITVGGTDDQNTITGVLESLVNPPGGVATVMGGDAYPGMTGYPGPFGQMFPFWNCMYYRPRPIIQPVFIPVPIPVQNAAFREKTSNTTNKDTLKPPSGTISGTGKKTVEPGEAPSDTKGLAHQTSTNATNNTPSKSDVNDKKPSALKQNPAPSATGKHDGENTPKKTAG